jgi:AcrR family transcriptional regulator
MHTAARPTMADRKRQLVRDELSAAALRLLAYQGFEETTIDQIVAAAGVSRRTFFRYFKSKEDVIIEFLGDLGSWLRQELAARPPDEPAPVALRNAVRIFVEAHPDPEKALRLARLIVGSPALRARFLERQVQWRSELAAELAARAGVDPEVDMRPALVAGIALTAFDTALTRWIAASGTEKFSDLVDQAFELVAPALALDCVRSA